MFSESDSQLNGSLVLGTGPVGDERETVSWDILQGWRIVWCLSCASDLLFFLWVGFGEDRLFKLCAEVSHFICSPRWRYCETLVVRKESIKRYIGVFRLSFWQ